MRSWSSCGRRSYRRTQRTSRKSSATSYSRSPTSHESCGIDPESALRAANGKFTRRFRAIEQQLAARGRSLHDATTEELEREWQAVKATEPEGAASRKQEIGDT